MPEPSLKTRLMHAAHLLRRPMTLGVRCAAFDAAGRLFLVRHTYLPGWYMPGGGVDPGETAEEAMRRELREEGNLALLAEPRFFGLYLNRQASRRDHVAFYVCRGVRQTEPKRPDFEIAESGFFAPGALPDGTTASTRRRLAEIAADLRPDAEW